MYEIDIINDDAYAINERVLQNAAATVLQQQNAAPESGLTVVVTSNEDVTSLNRQYRGVDAPTDVLSFTADVPPDEIVGDDAVYLGDIMIAYPYALAQAEREGHNRDESFALLVVHGTLHLLGYDHDTPGNRAAMWAEQEKALVALGISPEIVPSLEGDFDDE